MKKFFINCITIIFLIFIFSNIVKGEGDNKKEFLVDDFENGVNSDIYWYGAGTYGHTEMRTVPYGKDNNVCEIDYSFYGINDDRIWIGVSRNLPLNDLRGYDYLSIKVIGGGYGGVLLLVLIDGSGEHWVYQNIDVLSHNNEVELHIPLKRVLGVIDISNITEFQIGISRGGNMPKVPLIKGKCWIDDIKFVKK